MRFLAVIILLVSASCATYETDIEPDWTSYPRGQVVNTPTKMWIAPSVTKGYRVKSADGSFAAESKSSDQVTYDYVKTKVGDKATHEVYIVPQKGRRGREDYLWTLVPRYGENVCDGDYRIARSRYYFGGEATLWMLGIKTPAMKIVFRCQIYFNKPYNDLEKTVRNVARIFDDFRFFDVLIKSYPKDIEVVYEAVKATAMAEGLPVLREGSLSHGGLYVLAGLHPRSKKKSRRKQLAAVLERDEKGGTIIAFELPVYWYTYHYRGVLRGIPPELRGIAPENRKRAYKMAKYFLALVEERLQGVD